MFWLALYIAAMFCIALPLAWFGKSPGGAAIFVTWGVGQIAYQAGMPEPQTQAVIYGVMFSYLCIQILVYPDRWSWRCVAAAMFFLPLFAVCYSWSDNPGSDPWWTIYWLAWAQLAFLIRPLRWLAGAQDWLEVRRGTRNDRFLMVSP